MSTYEAVIKSSSIPNLGLPLGLLPSIRPSITSFNRPSPLKTCPIHLFFLLLNIVIISLSSPTLLSTTSFEILSFQLIFSVLLHSHISRASNFLISSFFNVHVSEPYSSFVHTNVLTIFTLVDFSKLLVRSSFLAPNASFAEQFCYLSHFHIFHHLSWYVLNILKLLTCLIFVPLIMIFTSPPTLDTFITLVFLIFIFIPYSSEVEFRPSIIFCRPNILYAIIPWSSANLTSFISLPPTFIPSSIPSIASTIIASA